MNEHERREKQKMDALMYTDASFSFYQYYNGMAVMVAFVERVFPFKWNKWGQEWKIKVSLQHMSNADRRMIWWMCIMPVGLSYCCWRQPLWWPLNSLQKLFAVLARSLFAYLWDRFWPSIFLLCKFHCIWTIDVFRCIWDMNSKIGFSEQHSPYLVWASTFNDCYFNTNANKNKRTPKHKCKHEFNIKRKYNGTGV